MERYIKPKVLVIEDLQGMKNSDDEMGSTRSFLLCLMLGMIRISLPLLQVNKNLGELEELLDFQTRRRFAGQLINF